MYTTKEYWHSRKHACTLYNPLLLTFYFLVFDPFIPNIPGDIVRRFLAHENLHNGAGARTRSLNTVDSANNVGPPPQKLGQVHIIILGISLHHAAGTVGSTRYSKFSPDTSCRSITVTQAQV